jgi:hypothetical protein
LNINGNLNDGNLNKILSRNLKFRNDLCELLWSKLFFGLNVLFESQIFNGMLIPCSL